MIRYQPLKRAMNNSMNTQREGYVVILCCRTTFCDLVLQVVIEQVVTPAGHLGRASSLLFSKPGSFLYLQLLVDLGGYI